MVSLRFLQTLDTSWFAWLLYLLKIALKCFFWWAMFIIMQISLAHLCTSFWEWVVWMFMKWLHGGLRYNIFLAT